MFGGKIDAFPLLVAAGPLETDGTASYPAVRHRSGNGQWCIFAFGGSPIGVTCDVGSLRVPPQLDGR